MTGRNSLQVERKGEMLWEYVYGLTLLVLFFAIAIPFLYSRERGVQRKVDRMRSYLDHEDRTMRDRFIYRPHEAVDDTLRCRAKSDGSDDQRCLNPIMGPNSQRCGGYHVCAEHYSMISEAMAEMRKTQWPED